MRKTRIGWNAIRKPRTWRCKPYLESLLSECQEIGSVWSFSRKLHKIADCHLTMIYTDCHWEMDSLYYSLKLELVLCSKFVSSISASSCTYKASSEKGKMALCEHILLVRHAPRYLVDLVESLEWRTFSYQRPSMRSIGCLISGMGNMRANRAHVSAHQTNSSCKNKLDAWLVKPRHFHLPITTSQKRRTRKLLRRLQALYMGFRGSTKLQAPVTSRESIYWLLRVAKRFTTIFLALVKRWWEMLIVYAKQLGSALPGKDRTGQSLRSKNRKKTSTKSQ